MSDISPLGRKAVEQARRGEFDLAIATAREALASRPNDKGLRFFAGLLHSRLGDFDESAAQFREALALAPDDPLVRAEFVRVLTTIGQLDEARALLDRPGIPGPEARRLRAMLAARLGDHGAAVTLYREVLAADPRDFESWGKLGASLMATGEAKAAVGALDQALQLKPGNERLRERWAEAQSAAGNADAALKQLYSQSAEDPGALVAAARIEDLQERPQRAVEALQNALDKDPRNPAALVALAELEERANRIDELEALVERIEQQAPTAEKLGLLRARAAYRRGDVGRALELAEAARADVDPAARAQLIGQCHDRLGDHSAAFDAFRAMNGLDSLATDDWAGKAERHLKTLREQVAVLTRAWAERWQPAPAAKREPAFLVGFPRSGTTLLDTLLTSDPAIAVSEEHPMLSNVSKQVGSFDRIADLGAGEVERLRAAYFEEAEKHVPQAEGRLLLDKFPLGLGASALIHRLFATAPIIFLSRHPCDVVLSCFMTRFQPTDLGSAFLDLEATARLYDSMMTLWTRSRELLPLTVLDARYESLVDDPAGEMRRVADFLGIAWSDKLADNCAAAGQRGFIKTPSYSQVSEPIYRRGVERWRNYSDQLAPAIPILRPWVEALGYEA